METIKLTALSHGAGCACKLSPAELHPLLAELPRPDDPRVLVGSDTADDAAAYLVAPDLAILTTADFFTPIVDDPYDFGRIAATNALSDIYAMGGEPLTALNLVAYSLDELGRELLREILRGGGDAAAAAGVAVVGGHSIDDREPKYGMAVTGRVHPDRLVRNSTGRAGDDLYLTKPLGGGVISTATKRGLASEELQAEGIAVMTTLNRDAAAQALECDLQRDDRRDRLRPAGPPARAHAGERRGGRAGRVRGARDRRRARAARLGRAAGGRRHPPQPRLGGALRRLRGRACPRSCAGSSATP